jgi:2,4-dienoyl-CoA reductase-like NADH-dependent reductase (Old Yellow Enzyme family)
MAWPDVPTPAAKGIPYFTPAQFPAAGTARDPQTSGAPVPKLFTPFTVRNVTFQNRIGLAPMCQYSAQDGHMTPWHLAHYGGIAQRGPGLMIIEATAVQPEGRITPGCVGLWTDSQIEPLKQVVDFAHSQGQKIGIQLAHAGRKATNAVGGWTDNVKAPSAVPFDGNSVVPKAMTQADIEEFKAAWVAAVHRSVMAGVDFIEIHNAHGYLLSSFLSPSSNQRTDDYGGSHENRMRLPLEVALLTRNAVGPDMPVFLRVSATDWLEEEAGWKLRDTEIFARALADQGAIDLIDISTGGVHSAQKITGGPAFQAPFAAAVKKAVGDRMLVAAVGMINKGDLADRLLQEKNENLDVILVGRAFQRDTGMVWQFAKDLDVEIAMAAQIRWGFTSFRDASEYIQPNSMKASIFD